MSDDITIAKRGGNKSSRLHYVIYIGKAGAPLFSRYQDLSKRLGDVSVSALIRAACEVCIPEFEKNLPKTRRFKMFNGPIIEIEASITD